MRVKCFFKESKAIIYRYFGGLRLQSLQQRSTSRDIKFATSCDSCGLSLTTNLYLQDHKLWQKIATCVRHETESRKRTLGLLYIRSEGSRDIFCLTLFSNNLHILQKDRKII